MAKKLWGGRFRKETNKEFENFSRSIHYDYKLAKYDIYHSIIHVAALMNSGILSKKEGSKLMAVLRHILREIDRGRFKPDLECEDIHSDIQNRVDKKAGKLAQKLHALRSRNDQIVFDAKLYCLDQAAALQAYLKGVFEEIVSKAKTYENTFFPGYTHLQRAQVILFSDYILAYAEMFARDYKRLTNFMATLNVSIGAGALAGSSLNSKHYQQAVFPAGVKKHFADLTNAVDNVSNRDFVVELLSILSLIQMHLSRLAEDLILYSTKEFDFVDLPEEFCTGSSLMPHKKNPDFLELVKGYTGRIYGNLTAVLTTMKGLALAYNRDMQLDKEPLFSSVEILSEELKIMTKVIRGVKLKKHNINQVLQDESLYATEITEFLVTKKGAAFAEAHAGVGRLIRYAEDNKQKIKDMEDDLLMTFHPQLRHKILKEIMRPEHAAAVKMSVTRKIPKLK